MGGSTHEVCTRPHLRTPGLRQVNGWFRVILRRSCCAQVSERHQGCPCGHAGYRAVVQGRLEAFLSLREGQTSALVELVERKEAALRQPSYVDGRIKIHVSW
eukprot:COSAG01_NODE_40777_length_459_cov_7.375000_1_plen_101_part_01